MAGKKWEYKCINSRSVSIKIKVGWEKWVILSVCAPGEERSVEEREVLGVLNQVRVIVGDLNAKVGGTVVLGIEGKVGVPRVNDYGESGVFD